MKVKTKIMLVLGGGGHSTEMIELAKELKEFKLEFVISTEDKLTAQKLLNEKFQGSLVKIVSPRRVGRKFSFLSPARLIVSFLQSLNLVIRSKSEFIITTGPGIAIFICYLGKLFGKKIIFIETISRVRSKSISGRLISLLADDFFVQWLEMKKVYSGSKYYGRLL